MISHRSKMISGGRIQVPADIRKQLGLADGDAIILEVENNEMRIRSYRESVRRVQESLRHLMPTDGTHLSDELIADRRKEAENE